MEYSIKVGRDKVKVKENIIDKVVRYIAPGKGLKRMRSRMTTAVIGGYTGASKSRRGLKGWTVPGGDADSDILPDLQDLRDRSRDLVRNTPTAASAINTNVTNVIGTGLKYHSRIDREYLGLTEEEAEAWEQNAERRFRLWSESVECDAARTLTFSGVQELTYRAALEGGDAFVLLPMIKRPGLPFGLKLQTIEADRVRNKDNVADRNTLAGGVETDKHGAPVNYHIQKTHPGNKMQVSLEWDVIPAFGKKTGRRNVLHLFDKRRPGQRRGVPYLAPVIESLKQLGRYTDAELMAAVVSGMFTVFIESDMPEELLDMPDGDTADSDSSDNYELGNGSIVGLAPGEKVNAPNPGRPNTAFDPFVVAIIRQIGAALEIPFELLMKHFTSSYSASKAAFMEAWKFFNSRRSWLVRGLCDPVLEAFMVEQVAKGYIYAPGFLTDPLIRKAYLGAEWVGPAKGQINELQEVKAARERVDAGFTTIASETASMTGGDWDKNHRQSTKETNRRRNDGLINDKNPQPPEPEPDPDEEDNKETKPAK